MSARETLAKARARLEGLDQYLRQCRISGTLHPLDTEIQAALDEVVSSLRVAMENSSDLWPVDL
jgi:hypothetical protein